MKKIEENSCQELILRYKPFYINLSEGFRAYYDDLIAGKFDSVALATAIGKLLLIKLLPLERFEQLNQQPLTLEQKQKLIFNKEQLSKVSLAFSKEYVIDTINQNQGIFDINWLTEVNPSDVRIAQYFSFTKDELYKILANQLSHIKSRSDQGNRDYLEIQTLIQKNQNSDEEVVGVAATDKLYAIFSKYHIFLSYQEMEALFNSKFLYLPSKEEQDFISFIADFANFLKLENTSKKDDEAENQEDTDLAAAIAMSLAENSPDQNDGEVKLSSVVHDANSSD